MKRTMLCLWVAVLLVACFGGEVGAAILFQDDFEGNDFEDKWVVVVGQWEVREVDGNQVAWHAGPGSETILIKDMIFGDFIAEMRMLHVTDDAGMQIYWATNEGPDNAAGDGYIFGEDAAGDKVRWYKVAGGSPTLEEEIVDIEIAPDTWTWFKLKVESTHAQMWYKREGKDADYILAFETNDLTEHHEGAIGTWVGQESLIDDVLVTDLQTTSVEPGDGLATTWAGIKERL